MLKSIKSINPMQKYPHIFELFVCILYMFLSMFSFLIKCLIYLRICSNPKLSKQIASLFETYTTIQWVPRSAYLSKFITYAPYFIFLENLSLE